MCCVVVLICAAVHFGSVSWPGSGFGEVRAILTLQLRRLFCSSDREEGMGQSVAAVVTAGGGGSDDVLGVDVQPPPVARLFSPSSLLAIG